MSETNYEAEIKIKIQFFFHKTIPPRALIYGLWFPFKENESQ
jgi:hypothetical protein